MIIIFLLIVKPNHMNLTKIILIIIIIIIMLFYFNLK